MAATASSSALPHDITSQTETIAVDPRGQHETAPDNTHAGSEIIPIDVDAEGGSENVLHSADTGPAGGSGSGDSEIDSAVSERGDSVELRSMIGKLGLTKLLHHAAQSGNIDLLKIVLEDPRTEVNAQQGLGCTALILACWKGHTEGVRLLLLKGADVLIGTEDGLTCLHMAAFCGHTEVVNLLLHGKSNREGLEKADPSLPVLSSKRCWALIERRTSTEMFTALHMAASASHDPWAVVPDELVVSDEMDKTFRKAKGAILEELRASDMFDALGLRESWLSKADVIRLASVPEPVQRGDDVRRNMLAGHDQGVPIAVSILEALRASVLDIYGLASNPKAACHIEDELWLNFLFRIRKELHLQVGDISEETFLQNLAAYGNDDGDGAALREKIAEKYEGLVRAYLELILYSNARDKIGRTALHHAAWEGKDKLVKAFMWDSGIADPQDSESRSKWGLNKLNPLKSQLGSVANINVVDVDGHAPLHLASRKGHIYVVEELLRGSTFVSHLGPLVGSQALPHKLLENLFATQSYLQPNPAGNPCGRSQKIVRAIRGSREKLGSKPVHLPRPNLEDSIWSEDRTGVTPLHYAVENRHAEVVDVLLMHPKIDVFQCASNGQSPWSIAFPSHWKLSRSPYTETQLWLRGDVTSPSLARSSVVLSPEFGFYWRKLHGKHQQRLLKRLVALALADENDSYASDNFEVLQEQIFLTFHEALANSYRVYKFPPSLDVDTEFKNLKGNIVRRKYYPSTLLHVAAYYGCDQELQTLLTLTYKKYLNDEDAYGGYTPLHFALFSGRDTLAVLMSEKALNLTKGNTKGLILLDFIAELRVLFDFVDDEQSRSLQEVQRILTEVLTPVRIHNMYRNRQVYVDAANAMLVGAALIASVTFAGFLQPPLGYVTYFTEYLPYPAPPSTPESFAAVGQHRSVRVFWVFNGLSFFSAIATVLAGAGAVLPSSGYSIDEEVRIVRRWLMFTSSLLAASIICVLGAFTAAGSASLPNISKYQFNIVCTGAVGLSLCFGTLGAFCYRLSLSL